MALPAGMEACLVTLHLTEALVDSPTDPDRDPDTIPIAGAKVVFRASLNPSVVRIPSADPPTVVSLAPITVHTDANGDLVSPDGQLGVYLIPSTDERLDPHGWTWSVTITKPEIGLSISTQFVTTPGGHVDLGDVVPVPPNPGTALLQWQAVVADTQAARDEALQAKVAAEGAVTTVEGIAASINPAVPAVPDSVVQRGSNGAVAVGAPVAPEHAVRAQDVVASRDLVQSVAVANGVADDRAALAAAATLSAAAGVGLVLRKGVYRVGSNLTINVPVYLQTGAIIKPDNGVVVVLAAGFVSDGGTTRQVFDHSAGGIVAPQNIPTNHPGWWGPVNTADDSPAWKAAHAAMQVSGVKNFTVPTGTSRIWLVDFTGIKVECQSRDDQILPVAALAGPGVPLEGTGYMIKLRTSSSITGGQWRTGGIAGVTVIFYTGHRAYVRDAWIRPTGADTVGVYAVSESGGSITPVLDNLWIEGISGSDPGVPGFPTSPMGTGILCDSADGRMTKITVAYLQTGVRILRGSWVVDDLHVWNCSGNGLELYFGVYARVVNSYLENNGGWGVYADRASRMNIEATRFWENGRLVSNTGGLFMRSEGTRYMEDSLVEAVFDDNVGTAVWLERTNRSRFDVRIVSTRVENGNTPLGTEGVRIQSNCYGNNVRISGAPNAVFGALPSAGPLLGPVLTNNAGPQNNVEFYTNSQIRGAVTVGPTTTKTMLVAIPLGTGHKVRFSATVVVDGQAANDLAIQIRTNNAPTSGWYAVDTPPKTSSTSGAEVFGPTATYAVGTSTSLNVAQVGLLGTSQAIRIFGYVEMNAAGTLGIYAGPATATSDTIAVAHTELHVTRVG